MPIPIIGPGPRSQAMGQLGQAMGMGINKNFAPPEQLVQRKMLQDSLDEVETLAKKGGSPLQMALGLIKSTAGIPGSEKYLSTLLPMILKGETAKGVFGEEGQDQPDTPGEPGQPQTEPQAAQEPAENLAAPIMRQMGIAQQQQPQEGAPQEGVGIQLGTYIPADVGAYIGPKQAKNIINKTLQGGGDANLAKGLINDYNKGQIDYNTLLNSNVDKQTAQIDKQLKLETQIKDFIDNQVHPDTPEERKNVYYSMMKKELKDSTDLTTAYQKVAPRISAFDDQLLEYDEQIPDFSGMQSMFPGSNSSNSIPESKEKTLYQTAKNILKTDPLAYPILESLYTKKGHPVTQVAKVLNPLKGNMSGLVGKTEDYRPLIYPKLPTSEKQFQQSVESAIESQEKDIKSLGKNLGLMWDETTSLLNIYTDLKTKGWFPQKIISLFDSLKSQGVEFTGQQEKELTQIGNNPPIPFRYLSR